MNPIVACISLVILAMSPAARAADSQWSVSAGPGFVLAPKYPGARDEAILPVPAIDVARGRSFFFNSRRGAGTYLVNGEQRQLGVSMSFRRGRDRRDGQRVAALESIDDHAVAQLFFTERLGSLVVSTSISQAILEDAGLTLDSSVVWQFRPSASTRAEVGIQGSFGNGEHMRTWFGISPRQALEARLPAYSIGAGFKSVGALAAVSHDLSPGWTVVAIAAYDALGADAADSPIVEREATPMLAVSALYHFGRRRL